MKNLVKIAAVAVLSLGFGVAAQAQVKEVDLVASAEVVDALVVEFGANLEFGQVMKGSKKYVNVLGDAVSSDESGAAGDAQAGFFKIFAGAGSEVTISFNNLTQLDGPTASDKLPILFNQDQAGATVTTVGYGTEASVEGLTRLNIATPNSITFPSTILEDDRNGTYVYVGGTVNPSGTQKSGNYSATLTLTATYN